MIDASAAAGAAKWIGTALIEEAKYLYGVKDHARDLQRDLQYMHQLLLDVDANPRLTSQDLQLRNLAQDIRELAFRAEDVIDSYIVDVATKIDRKRFFLKLACLAAHPYQIHNLIKEIEAIQQEIQRAKERFQTFRGILNPPAVSSPWPTPVENYIHIDDEVVVGLDADISHLANCLINKGNGFKVLAIVGIGGAGKTTLATKLYHHRKVENRFPHKVFVSISRQWSRIDVLQRIYKQLNGGGVIPSSEPELVRQLYYFFKKNQSLVVLDDMWKKEAWDDLYPILPRSNEGCRVIITTQIEEVPFYADSKCIIHKPKLLTDDQKWELFSKVAMEGRVGIENNDEFEKLGRQMLEKCEGLPLAVVTLAGVLGTKQEWYEWEKISKAYVECILKGKGMPNYGVVEDMLELSYLDLPTYLKPCFLYFAIFLKDQKIPVKALTEMWIGEGFVTNDLQRGRETLEDAAMRLVEELAQRCLLQVTVRNIRGQIHEFRVHDLMREFCIEKAKEHQFVGPVKFPSERGSRQPRRTSVLHREYYPQENDHLRTLIDFGDGGKLSNAARENLESIPNKFKLLRVLCIWYIDYVALPNEIGNLIHLRFLSIADTQIVVLPKSIRNLRNLLYLFYKTTNDEDVVEVPDCLVGNMENLRGLILPPSLQRGSLKRLGLSGPKNLQSLSGGAGTWMTKELPTLSPTIHNLKIHDIQKREELEALYQCSSIREDSLCRLTSTFYSWRTEEPLEFDLKKLSNCTTLWDLELDCPLANNFVGTIIQFPPNLVRLALYHSEIKEGDLMHVLGELPKLKFLSLSFSSYLGTQLRCTARGFPQLQELQLRGLKNLKEWIVERGAMPHLRKLWIEKCLKLNSLPRIIRYMTTLKELNVTGISQSTTESEDTYIHYLGR